MNNQIIVAMDNEISDGIELIAKTQCSKENMMTYIER